MVLIINIFFKFSFRKKTKQHSYMYKPCRSLIDALMSKIILGQFFKTSILNSIWFALKIQGEHCIRARGSSDFRICITSHCSPPSAHRSPTRGSSLPLHVVLSPLSILLIKFSRYLKKFQNGNICYTRVFGKKNRKTILERLTQRLKSESEKHT